MAKAMEMVNTGNRPDLAMLGTLSQLDMGGYAFPKIFSIITVRDKAGTTSFAPRGLTNVQGIKDRANGAALTKTTSVPVNVSWTTHRYEGRHQIYFSDTKAFGDIAAVEKFGAEQADRSALDRIELDAFDTIFTSARLATGGFTSLANHAILKTMQKAAKGLRPYGKPFMVMSYNTWEDFLEIPEIRWRLQNLSRATGDIGYLSASSDKVLQAVSTFFAFQGIILFDNDHVVNTADATGVRADGYIAIIALRPENIGASPDQVMANAKAKATYGTLMVYLPDEATTDAPFEIRAYVDDDAKANCFDAEGYAGITVIHDAAVVVCKLDGTYTEYGTDGE